MISRCCKAPPEGELHTTAVGAMINNQFGICSECKKDSDFYQEEE